MKEETQIGCGYCANEIKCKKRTEENKAKRGCVDWIHWEKVYSPSQWAASYDSYRHLIFLKNGVSHRRWTNKSPQQIHDIMKRAGIKKYNFNGKTFN